MALLTFGTSSTSVLRGLLVSGNMNAADVASFNALAKTQDAVATLSPTRFNKAGMLYLQGERGAVQCKPGDYIVIDPTSGWPIVVTAQAVSGGSFVHS